MSSRIAACGQPPVSTARMRCGGQRLVARQELGVLAREDVVGDDAEADARRAAAGTAPARSAVLPLPTGPPMPTVNARARKSRAQRRLALLEAGPGWCQCSCVRGGAWSMIVAAIVQAPQDWNSREYEPIVGRAEQLDRAARSARRRRAPSARAARRAPRRGRGASSRCSALRLVAVRRGPAARPPRARRAARRCRNSRERVVERRRRARANDRAEHAARGAARPPRGAARRSPELGKMRAAVSAAPGPASRLARLATWFEQERVARARRASARRAGSRMRRARPAAARPAPACRRSRRDEGRATSASRPRPRCTRRLEPARVREAAGRERRVGELQQSQRSSCASEQQVALRERQRASRARSVSSSPSARTS